MPTFQVKYEAEKLLTIRNHYASSVWEVIDKVIDREAADWTGETVLLEIKQLETK